MAGLYADEDFDFRVVVELRLIGHDVLTVQEAGQGNKGSETLTFWLSPSAKVGRC